MVVFAGSCGGSCGRDNPVSGIAGDHGLDAGDAVDADYGVVLSGSAEQEIVYGRRDADGGDACVLEHDSDCGGGIYDRRGEICTGGELGQVSETAESSRRSGFAIDGNIHAFRLAVHKVRSI